MDKKPADGSVEAIFEGEKGGRDPDSVLLAGSTGSKVAEVRSNGSPRA
jgi:hypothetical protein